MIITKEQFLALPRAAQEHIIEAIFRNDNKNFTKSKAGLEIDSTKGYSIRVAALLTCELPDEIVKKIFVLQQDSNEFIVKLDLDEFSEYASELEKSGQFVPERDNLVVLTQSDTKYQEYNNEKSSHGKLIFMSVSYLLNGIDQKFVKNANLRHILQHYGFVKEKDEESY